MEMKCGFLRTEIVIPSYEYARLSDNPTKLKIKSFRENTRINVPTQRFTSPPSYIRFL